MLSLLTLQEMFPYPANDLVSRGTKGYQETNSQCMFTAAQYCHRDGKAICVPPFRSSGTLILLSLYLFAKIKLLLLTNEVNGDVIEY